MNVHNHWEFGINGRTVVTEGVVYRVSMTGYEEVLGKGIGTCGAHRLPDESGLPGYHYRTSWPITFVDSVGDVMRWTGKLLERVF